MAVKTWHYGKLILLWCWGAVLIVLLLQLLDAIDRQRFIVGTIVLLLLGSIPVALSVLTWKWLSGKEGGSDADSN